MLTRRSFHWRFVVCTKMFAIELIDYVLQCLSPLPMTPRTISKVTCCVGILYSASKNFRRPCVSSYLLSISIIYSNFAFRTCFSKNSFQTFAFWCCPVPFDWEMQSFVGSSNSNPLPFAMVIRSLTNWSTTSAVAFLASRITSHLVTFLVHM